MDQTQALTARQNGELTEAILTPDEDANGWMLLFTTRAGEHLPYTVQGGRVAVFHDLDQATRQAKELGFAQVRIEERF